MCTVYCKATNRIVLRWCLKKNITSDLKPSIPVWVLPYQVTLLWLQLNGQQISDQAYPIHIARYCNSFKMLMITMNIIFMSIMKSRFSFIQEHPALQLAFNHTVGMRNINQLLDRQQHECTMIYSSHTQTTHTPPIYPVLTSAYNAQPGKTLNSISVSDV